MSKTRNQLIDDIKRKRGEIDADLSHTKGLTSLKKEELKKIYNEIENIKKDRENFSRTASEKKMTDIKRKKLLEGKFYRVKMELENLESQEDVLETKKVKLDELEPDKYELEEQEFQKRLKQQELEQKQEQQKQELEQKQKQQKQKQQKQNESDNTNMSTATTDDDVTDDDENDDKKTEQYSDEKENDDYEMDSDEYMSDDTSESDDDEDMNENLTVKEYEHEIKIMMNEYAEVLHDLLLEFDHKDFLSAKDVREIKKYHREQRNIVKYNLKKIYEAMPRNKDFSEKFYNYIEKAFVQQENKVEDFLS